jgi:hypothetical protein
LVSKAEELLFDLAEESEVVQLSVIVTFLVSCLHSCESSSCVEDGVYEQESCGYKLILKVILAQLVVFLNLWIY